MAPLKHGELFNGHAILGWFRDIESISRIDAGSRCTNYSTQAKFCSTLKNFKGMAFALLGPIVHPYQNLDTKGAKKHGESI